MVVPKGGKRHTLMRVMRKKVQSLSKMPRNTSLQLVCCVFVVVSLITTLGSRGSGLGDVCPKDRELHAIPEDLLPKYSENPAKDQEHFTLMLNSFHRLDLMKASIAHYARCPIVNEIRVIWCEDGIPPGPEVGAEYYSKSKKVIYDIMPDTSLNNRFSPIKGEHQEPPCLIRSRHKKIRRLLPSIVDLLLTALEYAPILAWRARKRQLVGPYIRAHEVTKDCRYKYFLGTGTLMRGKYSIVLSKAALLHRDYLEMYTNHMPKGIRDYVDKHHNCEDLAMQFLVTNATQEPPEFVNSFWTTDKGKGPVKVKGISSGNHHQQVTQVFAGILHPFRT